MTTITPDPLVSASQRINGHLTITELRGPSDGAEEADATANDGCHDDSSEMNMAEMAARATSLDCPAPPRSQSGPIAGSTGSQSQRRVLSQAMPPGSRSFGSSGAVQCATTQPQTGELNTKLGTIKAWGVNTYKCTKQIIQEKLGKSPRTVDVELEKKVDILRANQVSYRMMLETARKMTEHFRGLTGTHRRLGEMFVELRPRQPDLAEELTCNAETQRVLHQNGGHLIVAMEFFTRGLDTLCNQTMEDTVRTVRAYEQARVEYDAYRHESELLAASAGSSGPLAATRAQEAAQKHDRCRAKYERLRGDLAIKLKFLEENRTRVMQRQLLLFHNAISAYFSGNQAALEATMKELRIPHKVGNNGPPSFLEQPPPASTP